MDLMDEFNGSLYIQDGKFMYSDIDGTPTEVEIQKHKWHYDRMKDGVSSWKK